MFAGFAVFSLLGFMATTLNKEVKDVVDSGRSYFLGAKGGGLMGYGGENKIC